MKKLYKLLHYSVKTGVTFENEIERIYNIFKTLTGDEKAKIKRSWKINNDIEKLCSKKLKPIYLNDLHAVVKNDINYGVYYDKQGELELREEISKYLLSSRAVKCNSDQIIITSGFSDSLFLVSSILKKNSNVEKIFVSVEITAKFSTRI